MAQGVAEERRPQGATPRKDASWRERRLKSREGRDHASDRPFEKAARWMLARGVHPNHLTFLQLPLYVFLIVCATVGSAHPQEIGWRLAFCWFNLLVPILDGGDGILARVGRLQSKAGAVLDSTFDTLGIAIVMWGAAQFMPDDALWVMLLFLGSIILFLQNALLDQKVIAYVRGPVLLAVLYAPVRTGMLLLPAFITVWLILWRTPATMRALGRLVPPSPPVVPGRP